MGSLIYLLNVSLDGFVAAPDGSLDWTTVDDELHTWFNEHERGLDATLYGRRIYELMNGHWPTADTDPNSTEVMREFARIWKRQPKVVFSTSLGAVSGNARLVRGDVADVLADVQREFPGALGVAGPTLAAEFIQRDLVDEYRLVVHPIILGGGKPYFPPLAEPLRLRLVDKHEFASGATYLGYERR